MNLHGLPPKFEIVVPPGRSYDHTGAFLGTTIVWPSTLIDEKNQVNAKWSSVKAALDMCSALDPSTIASFQADYQAWRQFYCNASTGTCTAPDYSIWGLGTQMDQAQAWDQKVAYWQQIASAKCGATSTSPTPAAGPGGGGAPSGGGSQRPGCGFIDTLLGRCAPAPCGWWDSMLGRCQQPADTGTSWASAVKWVAILGVLGVTVWYLGPFIATAAGALTAGAGKVKRRIEGGAPEGAEYAGFSFGDMSVEAPKITSLDFGDIAKDDVLDILKKGGA